MASVALGQGRSRLGAARSLHCRARMRDLRHAVRQLGRAPGFAAVAVLTLTLGMGATTAFFSALYGVVLRQPSYPDAARIVSLHNTLGGNTHNGGMLSRAEVRDYRERQRAFESIAASDLGRMTLTSSREADGFAERVKVSRITPDLFSTLGVAPAIGRGIAAAAERATPVAVVSHTFWQAHLGATADALARTVRLNGIDYAVVGVMPQGFSYPEPDMAAWLPLDLEPRDASDRSDHYLAAIGRLAPGRTTADARRDLQRVARQLQQESSDAYPADESWSIRFESLRQRQFGRMLLPLGALMAGAASVLLIACVNVAIMSLLRALERRREIAIRLALGASRRAVVKQLVTEAGVLSALGACGGLLLASVGLELLKAFAPSEIPRLDAVALDRTAALFTALVLIVVTLIVGLAPAVVASRMRAFEGVVPTTRSSDGRAAARLRDALTVMEITLAASLVMSAGLTLRSLQALTRVDMGFGTERLFSFKTNLTAQDYPDARRVDLFYERLTSELARLPGTITIAAISYLPLSGEGQSIGATPVSAPAGRDAATEVAWRVVRGPYFETMGVRLIEGRLFQATDRSSSALVAVVDDVIARQWWGTEAAAIGKVVRTGTGAEAESRSVIGVVHRVNEAGPGKASLPILYAPQSQVYQRGMYTVLRTSGTHATVMPAARAALASVDPAVPMYFAETVDARYDRALALPRFTAGLVGAFSTLALVLAGVGVFGVTAYAVRQRMREFAIRFALGAQRAHVCALVLLRVGLLTGVGLAIGGALGLGVGSLMSGLLFGVEPADVPSMASAVAAIAATALAASVAPLRHAVRVHVAEILRAE
jgi:putative ABC transport system permease protein